MSTETQTQYAQTVYATPDEWGSQTVYADESGMQTTIASLIDAGGEDWAGIDLGDCAEWELVQVVNGMGLYEEQHVRNDSYMALRLVDGDYQEVYFDSFAGRRIAQYGSLEDAIEELSD
jgi:hypothetical protein